MLSSENSSVSGANEIGYPRRSTGVKDIPWLVALLVAISFSATHSGFVYTCAFSRFYFGSDSWGNICSSFSLGSTPIAGLNGSGKHFFEQNYVWLLNFQQAVESDCYEPEKLNLGIKLCVKSCPQIFQGMFSSNASELCFEILQENGYDKGEFSAAQAMCESIDEDEENCSTNYDIVNTDIQERNISNLIILGRCLPKDVVDRGISTFDHYLESSHYIVHDLQFSLQAIILTTIIVTSFCVFLILIIAWEPEYAFWFCHFVGITGGILNVVFFSGSLHNSVTSSKKTVPIFYSFPLLQSITLVYLIGLLLSLAGLALVIVLFIRLLGEWRFWKGFMARFSKVIHFLPKLMSQPLLTLFIAVGINLNLVLYLFHVTNCRELQAAPDNLTVEYPNVSPAWSSPALYVPVVFVNLWGLLILKHAQETVIAGTVYQWYFSQRKQTLPHPMTTSFLNMLLYNVGSVVACSFSGTIQNTIRIHLSQLIMKRNKVAASSQSQTNVKDPPPALTSWRSYLSPASTIAIGVYGYVRTTNICGDPYLDKVYFNRLTMPLYDKRKSRRCKKKFAKKNACLNEVIRSSHTSTKQCLSECHVTFVCFSMHIFLALSNFRGGTMSFPLLPFLITLFLSDYVCNIWLGIVTSVIDTLAVCLYEDLARNDGKTRYYYGSRGFISRVTGASVSLKETYGGARHYNKIAMRFNRQKQREMYLEMLQDRAREKLKRRRKNFKVEKNRMTSHGRKRLLERIHSFNMLVHYENSRRAVLRTTKEKSRTTLEVIPSSDENESDVASDADEKDDTKKVKKPLKKKSSLDLLIEAEWEKLENPQNPENVSSRKRHNEPQENDSEEDLPGSICFLPNTNAAFITIENNFNQRDVSSSQPISNVARDTVGTVDTDDAQYEKLLWEATFW